MANDPFAGWNKLAVRRGQPTPSGWTNLMADSSAPPHPVAPGVPTAEQMSAIRSAPGIGFSGVQRQPQGRSYMWIEPRNSVPQQSQQPSYQGLQYQKWLNSLVRT